MKIINPFQLASILLFTLLISSCSVVNGIFNAGMSFGIIIILAIIVVIVFIIMKSRKNKL